MQLDTSENTQINKIIIVGLPIILYAFLLLDKNIVESLTREDGLVETLGAISLLLASFFFFLNFKRKKNIFYLFFGMLFLFGFLEEISWGQRILGYETPKFFHKYNLQNEVNIHNLKWFHGRDIYGAKKSFWGKLINLDRLFSMFWLCYFVVIPISVKISSKIAKLIRNFPFPIVPVFIGFLFLMNYICSKAFEFYLTGFGDYIDEIKETNFEYLLFMFSLIEFMKLKHEKNTISKLSTSNRIIPIKN